MSVKGVLFLTDREGLVFWPRAQVAMVREERDGRLEALSAWGDMAHRPGPLSTVEGPPLVPVGRGMLINPEHAGEDGDGLRLPGGWRVEGALHPDLRQAGRDFVNPRRIRKLRRSSRPVGFVLEFDEGSTLRLTWPAGQMLTTNRGLEGPDQVAPETPTQQHLRRFGIRRWPLVLGGAGADYLRGHFQDDPVGFDLPLMLVPQLDRYGAKVKEIRRLVTPDRFTDEEIDRLGVPIPQNHPKYRGRVKRWLQDSEGRAPGSPPPADLIAAADPTTQATWPAGAGPGDA